jgi:hypothetical protein
MTVMLEPKLKELEEKIRKQYNESLNIEVKPLKTRVADLTKNVEEKI